MNTSLSGVGVGVVVLVGVVREGIARPCKAKCLVVGHQQSRCLMQRKAFMPLLLARAELGVDLMMRLMPQDFKETLPVLAQLPQPAAAGVGLIFLAGRKAATAVLVVADSQAVPVAAEQMSRALPAVIPRR